MGTLHGPRTALFRCHVVVCEEIDSRTYVDTDLRGYGRTAEDAEAVAEAMASQLQTVESDTVASPRTVRVEGSNVCHVCGDEHDVSKMSPCWSGHGDEEVVTRDHGTVQIHDIVACMDCLSDDANDRYAQGLGAA